jgi:hypothetical protein
VAKTDQINNEGTGGVGYCLSPLTTFIIDMIFQNYLRTYIDRSKGGMTTFEFLDKSAWEISALMREHVNGWSLHYAGDADFLSKYRSMDDKQHYAASFELMMGQLFKQAGWTVEKHPSLGASKKPDFKLIDGDGYAIIVECTLAASSMQTLEEKRRVAAVENIFEEIHYPYYIYCDFEIISAQSISKKKLMKFLEELLPICERLSEQDLLDQEFIFTNNGWELRLILFRKPDGAQERTMAASAFTPKPVDSVKPLVTSLNDKKPGGYGKLLHPYVIALNTNDFSVREEDYASALFGPCNPQAINLDWLTEKRTAIWYAGGKPVNTSISSVLICHNLDLFTLGGSTITLWHNPFAQMPVALNTFPFDEIYYERNGNKLIQYKAIKSYSVFNGLSVDEETYRDALSKR